MAEMVEMVETVVSRPTYEYAPRVGRWAWPLIKGRIKMQCTREEEYKNQAMVGSGKGGRQSTRKRREVGGCALRTSNLQYCPRVAEARSKGEECHDRLSPGQRNQGSLAAGGLRHGQGFPVNQKARDAIMV
jgi:hypothetical protein